MRIEEISVTYTEKEQIEQYSPTTISETLTAVVGEDDDVDEVRDELHEQAKKSVQEKMEQRRMEAEGIIDEGESVQDLVGE